MRKIDGDILREYGEITIRSRRECETCGGTFPSGTRMIRKKYRGRIQRIGFECMDCYAKRGEEQGKPWEGFKVGDRVIYNPKRTGNGWLAGEHGTVIYVDSTEAAYTVEFDVPIMEGVTDYRARDNGIEPMPLRGWFCKEENLEHEKAV